MPNKATTEERRLHGRAAAYKGLAGRSTEQTLANLAHAREELRKKFEREVDPDGVLNPEERARRAAYARKAHLARIGLKGSAVAKQRRADRAQAAAVAELDQIIAAEATA